MIGNLRNLDYLKKLQIKGIEEDFIKMLLDFLKIQLGILFGVLCRLLELHNQDYLHIFFSRPLFVCSLNGSIIQI
jgi:hypothetical protein